MAKAASLLRRSVLGPRVSAALSVKPVYRVVRLILGGLFIWAGVLKFMDLDAFANVILAYDLVPESVLTPLVLAIPTLEIAAGLGTILGWRPAFWGMLGLLCVFLLVLWFGILKDLDIDCGCFSLPEAEGKVSLSEAFARDLVFVLGVMYLLAWPRLRANATEGRCG